MYASKLFSIIAGILLVIIASGIAFQRPYVSPEEVKLSDRNQLLRLILNDTAIQIRDDYVNNPDRYKAGFFLLNTSNLEGLEIPTKLSDVPLVIVNQTRIDSVKPETYAIISIGINGLRGNVTITREWNFGGGFWMDSGLTLFCSKVRGAWKIDYGRGWIP
jgi:hypothetical protein